MNNLCDLSLFSSSNIYPPALLCCIAELGSSLILPNGWQEFNRNHIRKFHIVERTYQKFRFGVSTRNTPRRVVDVLRVVTQVEKCPENGTQKLCWSEYLQSKFRFCYCCFTYCYHFRLQRIFTNRIHETYFHFSILWEYIQDPVNIPTFR